MLAIDGVYACCAAVRCTDRAGDRAAIARLTAVKPHARVTLPARTTETEMSLRLEAEPLVPTGGTSVVIREGPLQERSVLVSPIDVSVVEPDRIVARLASERIMFANVELRPSGLDAVSRVLRPGADAEFVVWRPDIFQPLAFDWRASVVRRADGGDTLPMETGAWTRSTERELAIAS
jgi:hypothetical protein